MIRGHPERPRMNITTYNAMSTDEIHRQLLLLKHWLQRYQHFLCQRAVCELQKRNTAMALQAFATL